MLAKADRLVIYVYTNQIHFVVPLYNKATLHLSGGCEAALRNTETNVKRVFAYRALKWTCIRVSIKYLRTIVLSALIRMISNGLLLPTKRHKRSISRLDIVGLREQIIFENGYYGSSSLGKAL